jgi:hypothetical protein
VIILARGQGRPALRKTETDGVTTANRCQHGDSRFATGPCPPVAKAGRLF